MVVLAADAGDGQCHQLKAFSSYYDLLSYRQGRYLEFSRASKWQIIVLKNPTVKYNIAYFFIISKC